MSGLVVGASDLIGRPGRSKQIHRGVAVPGLRTALGWVDDDAVVQLDLTLDSVPEGVVVSGSVSGTMHLSCSRCLIGYDRSFDQPVNETFSGAADGSDDGDGYLLAGDQIDLEPMVRDVIVLAIPPVPLHNEACRGLCSTCGGDLNTTDCGHTQAPEDLRWAPLKAVFADLDKPAQH